MISVIIPAWNAQTDLGRTLAALVPAALDGMVREVIIADGGSQDGTAAIAEAAGARFLRSERGRGAQLRAGAQAARSAWLLFLHADTALEPEWAREARLFIRQVEDGAHPDRAAAFRFALDDQGFRPRYMEAMVALRCLIFRLPYGDQGLLISRQLYEAAGGYQPMPLMEDVDLARRLGRRIALLQAKAVTSAKRYKNEGYARRVLRNLSCLAFYYLRVPPRYIVKLYG